MENLSKSKRAIPNAAVIGCGNIGSLFDEKTKLEAPTTHVGAYLKNPNIKLIALCDENEKRVNECGQARNIQKTYTKYEDLLSKEPIDILSICTPPSIRLPIIKAALDHGITNIICEKPLALSIDEAIEIASLEKTYEAHIGVNFIRRWNPAVSFIKECLTNETYGHTQTVNLHYECGLLNNGSHILDLVNHFWGNEIDVRFTDVLEDGRGQTDPTLRGLFYLHSRTTKIPVTLSPVDYRLVSIFEMDIILSKGRLRLCDAGDTLEVYTTIPDPECPQYPILKRLKKTQGNARHSFSQLIQNAIDVWHGSAKFNGTVGNTIASMAMLEKIRRHGK